MPVKVAFGRTLEFVLGFFGWIVFGNLAYWIFMYLYTRTASPPLMDYVMSLDSLSIWLATIILTIVSAKTRRWIGIGILSATFISMATGLLWTMVLHFQHLESIMLIALTPVPTNLLMAIGFTMGGPQP